MNGIYHTYKNIILTGFGFIHAEAADIYLLLALLAGFSIVIGFLISPKEINTAQPLAWGIMGIGLAIFIDYFPELSQKFGDAMWEVGTQSVGGSGISDFEDFDGLLQGGYDMAKPTISSLHGWSWWEIASNLEDYVWGWIVVLILIGTNAYLAFRLFVLMLSYLTMSLVAMICFPAMMWNRTAFMAEGAMRFIAGTAISILGMGLVLAIVWGGAEGLDFLPDMTKSDTLINVATSCVGMFLAIRTQSIIQGYAASGLPNTSSGIGSTIRSGLHAMHAIQSISHAARSVSDKIHSSGPQAGARNNSTPTNPGISPSSGTGNGTGGQWRQPNARSARNP